MNKKIITIVFSLALTLLYFGNSYASTPLQYGDRLYDPALRLSFPKDANLAHSVGFTYTGSGGMMLLNDAIRFIQDLNDQAYLGYRNWRLPTLSELKHLYNTDGISYVYKDSSRGLPFDNLKTYYWADGQKSFSFISGTEISFAAYRFVLPVAPLQFYRYQPFYPRPLYKLPVYPLPETLKRIFIMSSNWLRLLFIITHSVVNFCLHRDLSKHY